jgi:hypothetical protein
MMRIKLSGVVAAAAWASVFVLSWLLILGTLEPSSMRTGAWIIFFVIAFVSSAIYAGKPTGGR